MFTWNFQYISKARLADAFQQLMLDPSQGDILIRIHTSIHLEEEAVDIAKFIAQLVPKAHIFGTSTSAVICWGKLMQNQCIVSVTQTEKGSIRTALLPTFDENDKPIPEHVLCQQIKETVLDDQTKLLLTFLTGKYLNVYHFVETCNTYFPGVQMIGGLANTSEINLKKFLDSGFIFNEKGWTNKG
ncbi:MAG: diguanylate cyclase, partial [Oscillospiraceae bacterium]|nr:diguanylate cyclase [Oscillospiraceae bacterium]